MQTRKPLFVAVTNDIFEHPVAASFTIEDLGRILDIKSTSLKYYYKNQTPIRKLNIRIIKVA